MQKNKALFPGTFDPFTNGHLEILMNALKEFDEVHVVIMKNENKQPYFTIEKRLAIIREIQNKKLVIDFWNGMATDYCDKHKIKSIVRGYRNQEDIKYEKTLEDFYRKSIPDLNFKLYLTSTNISSYKIKEKIKNGEDISNLVPWKANYEKR